MKHADKSKRTRNLCNAAMLCCATAVLLTGLGRTLLRPKDVNYYENRPANTVAPLTAESWLDGSFQDAMEAALSDQIPLAQAMKKTFNDAQNKIRYDSMMRLSHRYPNVPVQYDQFLVYGGKYLAYAYCSPDMVIPELTRHSENLNALIAAHPDVTFYLYMVEGDSNNNFPAGENNGAFEYLSSRVNLPAEQMGRFAVDELETYERDFYQTDHHWCNVGSYRGYREAAALLGCTDLLEPLETVRVSDHFSGSKALSIGAQEQFFEPMDVYRFAFPKMSVTIAGEPADDYGWQDAALSGQLTDASYGGVYGWDNGEVILDTGTTGRGNLLMLGESYDNAILKLMASHFDRVYSVDLRSYEQDMGKPFRLAEYLREHRITKVLLIGSSFYTFQILSYVIDLYRGKIALQRNFFYLLMYVSFFPQLIAGPIVRYETVEQEIRERQVTMDDLAQGFRRFVVGLAKKLLLANQVAQVATIVYSGNPANYGSLMYWLAAIAYTLQIYFDFSGYSDMAIGLGRMFGFHFLENFNYPYISLSVTEFWRRWHISLSTWFRDYVYIPLGGNRVSRGKWVRNILVVWGLTGLWHGADWNFLLWGLYYGVLLLIEKLWLGKYLERLPKALRWLLCMIIVCIGWVMFNLTDFAQMRCALARMFSFTHVALSQSLAADVSIVPPLLWMLPALVFSTPVCRRVHLGESCGAEIVRNVVCLALLAVCIVFSVSATFNPFIYFRF